MFKKTLFLTLLFLGHQAICMNNKAVENLIKYAETMSSKGHPIYLNINSSNTRNEQVTQTKVEQKIEYNYLKNIKESFIEKLLSCFDYIKNNPVKIACATALGFYTYKQTRLMFLKNKLTSELNWSTWKKGNNLEELYHIPQAELAKNLLDGIQRRYISFENISDFSKPITQFLETIKQETSYLIEYQDISKNIFLRHFIFYDQNFLDSIPEKINRLSYLKASLLNWLIEYKVHRASKVNLD